jgi:integrase
VPTDKLSTPQISAAIKHARHGTSRRKLFDGKGLYLLVVPPKDKSGKPAAYWRLKYRIDGTEKLISLGVYDDVSLASARTKRDKARSLLKDDQDPSAVRQAQKAARRAAKDNTFEAIAREWFGKRSRKWASSHAEKVLGRMEKHLFPPIGSDAISALGGPQLLTVLRAIEDTGTVETAHRCRQYMNSVFRYGIQTHRIQANPTPHPETLSPPTGTRFASITDARGVGALMRSIRGYQGAYVTRAALQLAPLLFVRPGELRAAQWSEIDLDSAEWRIPAERMKMRRPHIIPLSSQAVEILRDLERHTGGSRYVFPSERSRDRPMSENTLNAALRSLGYDKTQMTGHGFRHMASTLLHDSRKWRSEAIERQLAHADKNSIRAVYNAAEYIEERQQMMQWWADHLDALAAGSNVVSMRKAKN